MGILVAREAISSTLDKITLGTSNILNFIPCWLKWCRTVSIVCSFQWGFLPLLQTCSKHLLSVSTIICNKHRFLACNNASTSASGIAIPGDCVSLLLQPKKILVPSLFTASHAYPLLLNLLFLWLLSLIISCQSRFSTLLMLGCLLPRFGAWAVLKASWYLSEKRPWLCRWCHV